MRPTLRLILAVIVLLTTVACRRDEASSSDPNRTTPAVPSDNQVRTEGESPAPPATATAEPAEADRTGVDAVDESPQVPTEREAIRLQPTNPVPQTAPPPQLVPPDLDPRFRAAAERWSPPADVSVRPGDVVSGRRLLAPQNAPVGMPDSVAQLLTGLLADQVTEELIDPTALPVVRELLGDLRFADGVERYWWLDLPFGADLQTDVVQYDALVEMIAPQQDLQVSIYVLRGMVVDVAVTPYRSTNTADDPTQ